MKNKQEKKTAIVRILWDAQELYASGSTYGSIADMILDAIGEQQ